MSTLNTYHENELTSFCTAQERETSLQLERLKQQLNRSLPRLPPQYDDLVGHALLNIALTHLTGAYGQKITANLLAGMTELLWNNSWPALNNQRNRQG